MAGTELNNKLSTLSTKIKTLTNSNETTLSLETMGNKLQEASDDKDALMTTIAGKGVTVSDNSIAAAGDYIRDIEAGFPNGTEWTQSNITNRKIYRVIYANGLWVAAGERMFYSSDGKIWSMCSLPGSGKSFDPCAYGNGIWVIGSGNSYGLYYSTTGTSWTQSNITDKTCFYVTYDNNIWIACNASGLYYSTDGKTWTQSNFSSNNAKYCVYANNIWIAATYSGLYYSEDGMNWTQSNVTGITYCCAYNNGLCVAASKGICYSTDGKTWTQSNITNGSFYCFNYANNIWVAGSYSKGLYYSTDGMTWTQSNVTSGTFEYCVNANGIWVACNDSSKGLYYSIDGMIWTQSNITDGNFLYCANGNGIWVAGSFGKGLYYSVTWEP